VRVLAEMPARSSPDLRLGRLRRSDLDAYAGLLEGLAATRAVLVAGDAPERQAGAVGLATAAAATGRRVALLECDLERPALADALGLATAPGLREYLLGEATAEDILKPLVLAGPGSVAAEEALVCIVAGRAGGDADLLLGSERFRHAVASLRGAYELLVIDGPPPRVAGGFAAAAAAADAVIAWAAPGEQPPALPVATIGVVVQR